MITIQCYLITHINIISSDIYTYFTMNLQFTENSANIFFIKFEISVEIINSIILNINKKFNELLRNP